MKTNKSTLFCLTIILAKQTLKYETHIYTLSTFYVKQTIVLYRFSQL